MKAECAVSLQWSSLNARRRARELDALASNSVVDVLVVGGGITGMGVALDAASRGLSVVLVERGDIGGGASSTSTDIIHGGVRYLQNRDVLAAVESALERGYLLQHTATHLVRSLPVLLPDLGELPPKRRWLARAGLQAGEALRFGVRTDKSLLPAPRRISGAEAALLFPTLTADCGGVLSFDAQLEDDHRLVVAVARTAGSLGAKILPRVSAKWVAGDGAQVRDELTGSELRITAASVINATGVWSDQLEPGVRYTKRRGSHIMVRSALLGEPRSALLIPVDSSLKDFVFVVGHSDGTTHIGATDIPLSDDDAATEPTAQEVSDLLSVANKALGITITTDEVIGSYSGLRPVGHDADGNEIDMSRKHLVTVGDTGAITVVGGKLTTYRKMAEDAVDRAIELSGIWAADCSTREVRLIGAAPRAQLNAIDAPRRLIDRYGVEATDVLALGTDEPRLLEPIAEGSPVIGAEFAFAVQRELAMSPEDLVDRRTRIGRVTSQRDGALDAAQQFCGDPLIGDLR
ncbi:MAG: glycerol-3-phosphate dehydrogenase/oxidase [Antricoccus sp.]